ncbi:MAG: extracellular solute-binding protein [Clostridiales bacterium]|nr:extracellular solute-binding protein [Clostridiales bacterium]
MKKSTQKFLSLGLALSLVFSLTACGSKEESKKDDVTPTTPAGDNTATTESTQSVTSDVEKPATINVMVDGTVFTEPQGRAQFESALEAELGIDIVFTQPDHSGYYDSVGLTFSGGNWPDVVILGGSYYANYASAGLLADLTEYWDNSELKASGRITNESAMESIKIDGKLYGFTPSRGNGCVTYVKKAWLDKAGLEVPTTYDEYLNMLKVFTESDMNDSGDPSNTYGVSAAGLIGVEAPYTNYLPEFYQDAYPDFTKDENGTWIDGFSTDSMKAALQRLKDAYEAGYIDKETITNGTKDCRNKFFDDKFGVFTYWAGTWASTLESNLEANNLDKELVQIAPIKEVGAYVERQAPAWCITTKAKNPAGIFKYFFETMLDGGAVQTLWTYGVKGVHWDDKAETIKLTDTDSVSFEEGQFHMLASLEKPDTLLKKAHIDPMLSFATYVDNADPGIASVDEVARKSSEAFNAHCTAAPVIISNDVMNEYNADLWDLRTQIVTKVVTGGVSVEDGMNEYLTKSANMVSEILESLNE